MHSRFYFNPFSPNTKENAPTIGCKKGTGFQSTGVGKLGIRLPYQRCSIHARRCRTICLPCGATSRRAGSGCVGRMFRDLAQPRDPRQRWDHQLWDSCPTIMTSHHGKSSTEAVLRVQGRRMARPRPCLPPPTALKGNGSRGRSVRRIGSFRSLRVPVRGVVPQVAQRYRTPFLSQFVPKVSKKRT
jgi:hypothetical protein